MKRRPSAPPAGAIRLRGAREQQLMQRRHRRVPRHAVIARDAPERQRTELRRHDDGAAGRERRERGRDEPVHVKQRHHAQRHVVGRQRVRARDVAGGDRSGSCARAARASAGRCCRSCAAPARRRRSAGGVDGLAAGHAGQSARCRPSSISTVRTCTVSPAARRASSAPSGGRISTLAFVSSR